MIRVLVVDDDFMVARVHRGFVDRVPGFQTVGVVHTGADALAQVEALRPDLVLLDIYLPDFSGLEVLRRLREGGDGDGPDVLAVTAARDVSTVRSALHGGVVHYVLKPFTFDVLRDRLERYAAAYGRLAETTDVEQADVDNLFVALRTTSAPLPKGLTADTSALIAAAMRACDGDLSASECAERIGLSRVSTRRYLEHFVTAGKAEVRLRYGSAGRPQRRYRWAG
ncbi:response regulator [Couchioplanes caeruleus]|uniref:Transcriptional regulatory protein n=2 Tax=Couchioplanes caeruleus TaxID=56438 RepID=A0A1K0FJ91_9ACTN|nr:response regulator [Couchioplanes caeruleus]OJF12909.1 two-component system response regulator [Couchioplanes caeruleus subsp. caeruleus]ROP28203.1 response regulator of citrate/malate metabolism [Couchioplanes caeruleus]